MPDKLSEKQINRLLGFAILGYLCLWVGLFFGGIAFVSWMIRHVRWVR